MKSFRFQYSYFNDGRYYYPGNSTVGFNVYNSESPDAFKWAYLYKRLKLENITELDKNGNPLNAGYSLKYFDGALPPKNINNTDYWGYNNDSSYDERYFSQFIVPDSETAEMLGVSQGHQFWGAVKLGYFESLIIGTLSEMTMPTGDTTSFEYEENSFLNDEFVKSLFGKTTGVPVTGGGLRIAKIKNGSKTRTFEYSGGKLLVQPILYYVENEQVAYGWGAGIGPINYTFLVQLSESSRPLTTLQHGNAVGYDVVRETVSDGVDTSTQEYCFHNQEEGELQTDNYSPFLPTEINFINGQIKEKKLYKNNSLVQTTKYNYIESDIIPVHCAYVPTGFALYHYFYQYNIRTILTKDEQVTSYSDGNPTVQTLKQYAYNKNFLLKTDSMQVNNLWHKTKYRYTFDFKDTDPISQEMTDKNIIGTPVEVIQLRNNDVISGQKTIFRKDATSGTILPSEQQQLQTTTALAQSNYVSAYKSVQYYDLYTPQGKIRQLHGADNMPVTYLWSYSGQYPIAEIKNATYEQVKNVLGENAINTLARADKPSDADIQAAGNNLRNNLPQAMVSTYTYEPLVGMTSATDARGVKTTYVYDEFQRLKNVLDFQNSKLQEYKYHYQNQ